MKSAVCSGPCLATSSANCCSAMWQAASWAGRSPNTFTGRRTFLSMKVMIVRHALVQAGIGQDLLRLVGPFGRVLGVLHRKSDRIAGVVLDAGDILGNVDVALLDAEVGIAAEDVFDLLLGEPVDLTIETLLAELGDLGRCRRSPVAEGAAERAAAIGLPQADPAFLRVARHDPGERASKHR